MPADDDEASGPPPHPLDRVWFHPSELGTAGSVGTLRPQPASPKVWLVAVLALLVGVFGTLGVVTTVGVFTDGGRTTTTRMVAPALVDPDAVARVATTVGRSIVTVSVTPFGGEATAAGSGIVWRSGLVLTAAHLVPEGTAPAVITAGGQLGTARVKGVDHETDLALLEVEGVDLVPARLATGDSLRIGKSVIALGAGPVPHRWAATGVISGLDRTGALGNGVLGAALIETDARLDGAAAGTALLDDTGAVIGILTGPGRTAVPVDVARNVVDQLNVNGTAAHGWTGVVGKDVLDRPGGGVRIHDIVPASPAEAAGLQLGDIVLAVGDTEVGNVGELVAAVRRLKPGDPVELTVIRADKRVKVPIALGENIAIPADWQVVA